MSDFDEWYYTAGYLGDDQNIRAKIAFEAGAQSQQQKIDELQKRIDEAMRFYNDAKSDVNIGMIRMAQLLKGEPK